MACNGRDIKDAASDDQLHIKIDPNYLLNPDNKATVAHPLPNPKTQKDSKLLSDIKTLIEKYK